MEDGLTQEDWERARLEMKRNGIQGEATTALVEETKALRKKYALHEIGHFLAFSATGFYMVHEVYIQHHGEIEGCCGMLRRRYLRFEEPCQILRICISNYIASAAGWLAECIGEDKTPVWAWFMGWGFFNAGCEFDPADASCIVETGKTKAGEAVNDSFSCEAALVLIIQTLGCKTGRAAKRIEDELREKAESFFTHDMRQTLLTAAADLCKEGRIDDPMKRYNVTRDFSDWVVDDLAERWEKRFTKTYSPIRSQDESVANTRAHLIELGVDPQEYDRVVEEARRKHEGGKATHDEAGQPLPTP